MEIRKLKDILLMFREERDWTKFHDPKNLAEAISIESAELLELFLWKSKEEIKEKINDNAEYKEEISDELADVITYCFQMANSLDLDIENIVLSKLEKVKNKYPLEKSKGISTKYTKL